MEGSESGKLGPVVVDACGATGGAVVYRGRFGLFCGSGFCKFPDDVVDLSCGAPLVPMLANPATVSLANAVNDLLLLLVLKPVDEVEYW